VTALRFAAWLAGVWTGMLAAIGLMAAPAAFAAAPRATAGLIAGRLFAQEAYFGLAAAIVLFLVLRREARGGAAAGRGSAFSVDMLLALGALFCTVAGYFALQPMMASARAGQGGLSFGTLHAVSAAFFASKGLLVAVLAWRLAPRRSFVSSPPSS
jgi:hypothetical protein